MKTRQLILLLFFSSLFLNSTCKKDNEPQLPPETTIGAMTFGCKIDGKVFVPKDGGGLSGLHSEYLFLDNGPGGGWFLNLVGANRIDNPRTSMSIETDSLFLLQGNSYILKREKGFAVGSVLVGIIPYDMGLSDKGVLVITKHDPAQRILSGKFSFTATKATGEKVNITEGRFDIRY